MELFSGRAESHRLLFFADQGILDAAFDGIEVTVEEETVDIEISFQLAVDPVKHIHVEVATYTFGIVVSCFDDLVIFPEVEGDEQ